MSYLRVQNVSLGYRLYGEMRMFGRGRKRRPPMFFALNAVSVDIGEGERVALLGRNGAGKTTLLRLMAGIYTPTSGVVVREGSIASLLTTGIGMDLEATGYENIVTSGLLLGLDRETIANRVLPEVEAFTELGDFLSRPMHTYSAGMKARLAFAVSTAIVPDILLMDEMIGAGDAFFVEKARDRINRVLESSSIVVLASHNLTIIRGICGRGIVLHKGKVGYDGDIESAIEYYKEHG